MEVVLAETGNQLATMERERQEATATKKQLEGENLIIKKDIEDLELGIQKLELFDCWSF